MRCLLAVFRALTGETDREVRELRHALAEARASLDDQKQACAVVAFRAVGDEALVRCYECKVCFDAPIQCVFLPCGHALCCAECGAAPQHCPLCALEIEARTAIVFVQ